jgi:hypothetical protein
VSYQDVTPDAVLHAVQAGDRTRADLGTTFRVLASSAYLTDAIEALVARGELDVDVHGVLTSHDLLENLEDR